MKSASAFATPMPARGHASARTVYRASQCNALHLTPADVTELDPTNSGIIVLFGLTYTREA